MFDKLDGAVVLRAVPFILELAARSTSRRYNLRSGIRSYITLHLSDSARHGIGIHYNGEACVTLSFAQIIDVCEHYIHNTHFHMSSVLILYNLVYHKVAHYRAHYHKYSPYTASTCSIPLYMTTTVYPSMA